MEGPLNMAHHQKRKAESFLRSGRFEDSLVCHYKAVEFLNDALLHAHCCKARESLELQRDYHIRQQAVVKHKQRHLEYLKKAQEKLSVLHVKEDPTPSPVIEPSVKSDTQTIRCAIYTTMAEQDSLLSFLLQNPAICKPETVPSVGPLSKSLDSIVKSAVKTPKSDETRLEELHIKSEELKRLVFLLCSEIEKYKEENECLRQTVSDLERKIAVMENRHGHIAVNPSSFLFSPVNEFSPGGSLHELPALPPLELPNVDFNALQI